jgi:hypothetical protein
MPFKKEIILVGTFHFEQDAELLKDKNRENRRAGRAG